MSDFNKFFSDGEAYERVMGRWSRRVGEVFLDWINVPTGRDWLDVGCGNGAFTETLIARCAPAKVEAIDPSEGQIAYARTRDEGKRARFHVAGAERMPFEDRSFDAVTMALVISFIPDTAKAVAEMARVVRPGGLVGAYMWDLPNGGLPVAPIYRALTSLGIPGASIPNAEISRIENLRTAWQKAGFTSVDTTIIRIPVAFSSFDDFWNSCTADAGPNAKTVRSLPPETREQLRSRLRDELPTGADGRIAYEAFANAVKGRRAAG